MRAQLAFLLVALVFVGCQRSTSPIETEASSSSSAMLTTDQLQHKAVDLANQKYGLKCSMVVSEWLLPDSVLKCQYYDLTSGKMVGELLISKNGKLERTSSKHRVTMLPIGGGGDGGGGGTGSGGGVTSSITLMQFFEDAQYQMVFGGTPLTFAVDPASLQPGMRISISYWDLNQIPVSGRSTPATWTDRISSYKSFPGWYGNVHIQWGQLDVYEWTNFRPPYHTYGNPFDDNFVDEHFCDDPIFHPEGCFVPTNDNVESLSYYFDVTSW